MIRKTKEDGHDRNATNISLKVLAIPQRSVLAKGPLFIPTPNDVNWLSVRKELDSLINKLCILQTTLFKKDKKLK